jgi:hypothetical protein
MYQTTKTGRNFPVYLEGDLPSPLREDGSTCERGGSDRLHCQESSVFLSNKFCSFLLQKKFDFFKILFFKCKSDFYLGKHRQVSDVTKFEFLKKNPARE